MKAVSTGKTRQVYDHCVIDLKEKKLSYKTTNTMVDIKRLSFSNNELIPMKDLPLYWDPMPRCRVFVAISLSPDQEEWKMCEKLIGKSIKSPKIRGLQRIQNPCLYATYKNYLDEGLALGLASERLLFHGTRNINIKSVCEENLDPNLCCRYLYGRGTYFSPYASYSSLFAEYTARYHYKLFIFKVAVGRLEVGHNPDPQVNFNFNTVAKSIIDSIRLNVVTLFRIPAGFGPVLGAPPVNVDPRTVNPVHPPTGPNRFVTLVDSTYNTNAVVQRNRHSFYPAYIVELSYYDDMDKIETTMLNE